jgi:hypothetical protein
MASDREVARHAVEGDFVLVTNNASDFRRLYETMHLHAGLIILIPSVDREGQKTLFRAALRELTTLGEPINHVLEVDTRGEEIIISIYDLPKSS